MTHYYYRVEHKRLNNGRPVTVRSGMYEGCLEFHVLPDGVDEPGAIPVRTEREIPWDKAQRFSNISRVLNDTLVTVGLPGGEETFRVVCDYGTCDSYCVVVRPLGDDDAGD